MTLTISSYIYYYNDIWIPNPLLVLELKSSTSGSAFQYSTCSMNLTFTQEYKCPEYLEVFSFHSLILILSYRCDDNTKTFYLTMKDCNLEQIVKIGIWGISFFPFDFPYKLKVSSQSKTLSIIAQKFQNIIGEVICYPEIPQIEDYELKFEPDVTFMISTLHWKIQPVRSIIKNSYIVLTFPNEDPNTSQVQMLGSNVQLNIVSGLDQQSTMIRNNNVITIKGFENYENLDQTIIEFSLTNIQNAQSTQPKDNIDLKIYSNSSLNAYQKNIKYKITEPKQFQGELIQSNKRINDLTDLTFKFILPELIPFNSNIKLIFPSQFKMDEQTLTIEDMVNASNHLQFDLFINSIEIKNAIVLKNQQQVIFKIKSFKNHYIIESLDDIKVLFYEQLELIQASFLSVTNGLQLVTEPAQIENFQVTAGTLYILTPSFYTFSFTIFNIQDSLVIDIPPGFLIDGPAFGILDVISDSQLTYHYDFKDNQFFIDLPKQNGEQISLKFQISMIYQNLLQTEISGFSMKGLYKNQIVQQTIENKKFSFKFNPRKCEIISFDLVSKQVSTESQYLKINFQCELAFNNEWIIIQSLFDYFQPSNQFNCFINEVKQVCQIYMGNSLKVQSTMPHQSQELISLAIQTIITPRSFKPVVISMAIENDLGQQLTVSQQSIPLQMTQVQQIKNFRVECIDCTVGIQTQYKIIFQTSQNLISNDNLILTVPSDLLVESLTCEILEVPIFTSCNKINNDIHIQLTQPILAETETSFLIKTITNQNMQSGPFLMKINDPENYQMLSCTSAAIVYFNFQMFNQLQVQTSSQLFGDISDIIVTFQNVLPIEKKGYLYFDIDNRFIIVKTTSQSIDLSIWDFTYQFTYLKEFTRLKIYPKTTLQPDVYSFKIREINYPIIFDKDQKYKFKLQSFSPNNQQQEEKDYEMPFDFHCSSGCDTCDFRHNICITCQPGFFALGFDCLLECPPKMVPQDNVCMSCHQNCFDCSISDIGVCTSCNSDLILKNGTCFTSAQLEGEKQVPIDPKPVDPAPVDPIPVDPTPVDPTPVDPTPVDPTPIDPTPVDPTPVDPTPVDPTPVDPTPVDPTPVDPTPVDPTPVDPTPVDPTPVDPTPVDPQPVDPLPIDPMPSNSSNKTDSTQPINPDSINQQNNFSDTQPNLNDTNSNSTIQSNGSDKKLEDHKYTLKEFQFREMFLTYIVVGIIIIILLRKICSRKINFFHALLGIFGLLDPILVILNFVSFILNQYFVFFCFSLCYTIGNLVQMMHSQMMLIGVLRVDPNYQMLKQKRWLFKLFNSIVLFYDWKFLFIMRSRITKNDIFDVPFTMLIELTRKLQSLLSVRLYFFSPLVIALSIAYLVKAERESLIVYQVEYLVYNIICWFSQLIIYKQYDTLAKALESEKVQKFQEELLKQDPNFRSSPNMKIPTTASNQIHPLKLNISNDNASPISEKQKEIGEKGQRQTESDQDPQKSINNSKEQSQMKSYDQ